MVRRLFMLLVVGPAWALPPGQGIVCERWPDAAECADGKPDCTTCHTQPPAHNAFGADIADALLPGAARPLSQADFEAGLPEVLASLADIDSDGDGVPNRAEMTAGANPGNAADTPGGRPVSGCESANPVWNVCGYDAAHAFKKLHLDVCGHSPDYAALEGFRALKSEAQADALADALDRCLDTPFWQGRDGVLWQLAHPKVKPLAVIKSGRDPGYIPLADYDDDYALFVYTQTDDRDARDVLTADYFVVADSLVGYTRVPERMGQNAVLDRRAGMITSRWFFVLNTMFTPVPRAAAAQAYRSNLGFEIARSEGLIEPDEAQELVDYDDKGILDEACAVCHRTLDPLTYPFSRYHGITGRDTGVYDDRRMRRYDEAAGSRIREVPEAGHIFGEPVANLVEWARVAADSEHFARATVKDYWRVLVGHDPTTDEMEAFEALVADFPSVHNYRVERMLHALIRMEAYGAP